MSRRQSLALGTWLASRGAVVASGFVVALLGAMLAVSAVAASGPHAAARVPWYTAQAVAWAAGVTVAFGGALHALRRDRDDGVIALSRARGMSAASYVQGRVGGLAVVVAIAVLGPTLAAGLASISLASLRHSPWPAVQTTLGALAYGLAFAMTIAPVALAALSASTRTGGYLSLLAVLALPELAAPWTSALLPHGWAELTSIPSALAAVGAVFASPAAAVHAARALVGLLAVIAASLVVVVARLPEIDARGAA
jgi:hypothetical protein